MNELERKKYLENIKNNLTIDQIYEFLAEMGGEPQIHHDIIISRTICHNPPGQGSFKLYYYNNTKLFKCFTQCNGTFDIFELTLKIKRLANEQIVYWSKEAQKVSRPWELPDAINFVTAFFNVEHFSEIFSERQRELQDWQFFSKKEAKKHEKSSNQNIVLNVFECDFLKNFPQPIILPWVKEGITEEVIKKHNICYNPISQAIVIPHYNINNELIGIRERTLLKDKEKKGKYIPAIIHGKMYNHPLGFNLYNINISKDNIKKIQKAIVFEGEKSPLLYESYFGIENDITVAVCGSNLISYQINMLLSLGVQEIIIGFDRQYEKTGDDNWQKWTKKLIEINNKYRSKVQISFLWDKGHLLDFKDSPIDKGPDVFMKLFQNRIVI